MHPIQNYIELAIKAAREAGNVLREGAGSARHIHQESARDVKLQADQDSEVLIRGILADSRLPVIGEEQGGDAFLLEGNSLYWAVDPLDGTYNYLRNIPMTAVSIGLMRGSTPVWGVIYDFNLDILYTGGADIPLEINGIAVRPEWAPTTERAVICCGFTAAGKFDRETIEAHLNAVQSFKKVRMIGSAALALAYVAAGQADAYREDAIWLWDVAAGVALVQAAGGIASMTPVAGTPLLFNVTASGIGR